MGSKETRRGHGEGAIYQRASDGKWVGSVNLGYENGRRKRKAIYGKTRREVSEKMKALLADQQKGMPLRTNERLTVEQFLKSWLPTIKGEVRIATYVQYEVSVRCHLIPKLGRVPISKLTPQDVRTFISAEVEEGLSPTTARLARAVLRRALEQAVEDNFIFRNPARVARQKGSTGTKPKYQASFMNEEEARRFLAAAKGHRLEALYSVAIALGMRRGEALGLRWCDVDNEEGTITITGSILRIGKGSGVQRLDTKTEGSRRTIRVPSPLLAALRAHKVQQKADKLKAGKLWKGNEWDLIFTSEVGTAIDPRNINRNFDLLLKKAGLERMRFHDTRHTAAALMLAQGIELKMVSQILGHSRIATTADIYGHLLPRQQQEAADKMGELLWGS
jgi:integrase